MCAPIYNGREGFGFAQREEEGLAQATASNDTLSRTTLTQPQVVFVCKEASSTDARVSTLPWSPYPHEK